MARPRSADRQVLSFDEYQKVSPRVRLAARLYATGACRTKQEASTAAGLHKYYLSYLNRNPRVNSIIDRVDEALEEGAVDMSKLMATLGRRAVRNIAQLMEESPTEMIRFKAAVDLADRNPETAKTQKHQFESGLSVTKESAEALARALVEAAQLRQQFPSAANGDFVTVNDAEIKLLGGREEAAGGRVGLSQLEDSSPVPRGEGESRSEDVPSP